MSKKVLLSNNAKYDFSKDSTQLKRLNPNNFISEDTLLNQTRNQHINPPSFSEQQQHNGAYNYDVDLIQEEQGDPYYDQEVMNQIQMEIYKSNIDEDQTNFRHKSSFEENDQTTDPEEYPPMRKTQAQNTQVSLKNGKGSNIGHVKNSKKSSKKSKLPIIDEPKKNQTSSESSIQLPLKSSKPIQKQSPLRQADPTINSQPNKKLKPNSVFSQRDMLKFSINVKLMRANLQVKKIIKCMDTSKIKDRAEAQFLVEVEDCKDLQLISNEEMVYFYKDILIDYYQGIHFS